MGKSSPEFHVIETDQCGDMQHFSVEYCLEYQKSFNEFLSGEFIKRIGVCSGSEKCEHLGQKIMASVALFSRIFYPCNTLTRVSYRVQ